jgi:hypothetical protein
MCYSEQILESVVLLLALLVCIMAVLCFVCCRERVRTERRSTRTAKKDSAKAVPNAPETLSAESTPNGIAWEHPAASAQRYDVILANIDAYDGTTKGQKEIV